MVNLMKNRHINHGFTLIELLVVIAIISFLVATSIGVAKYAKLKAMQGRAKAELGHIALKITEYQVLNGIIPGNLSLIAGTLPLNVDTNDPWDQPYVYATNSARSYTLYSLGAKPFDEDDIYVGQ